MATPQRFASLHTELSSKDASLLLGSAVKDLEFEVTYFQISCVAATPRYILTYGQANWKNHHPKDFFGPDSTEKYEVAFGCLPSLKVKAAEGEGEILLAEAFNIDLYLAKKFGLLGENEYEEATIRAFYSQIHFLRERSLMRMTWTFPDKRKESWETFVKTTLPDFIRKHEQHLERNGSNGHYFGDKLSLADIHLMSVIDHFLELPRGEELIDMFKASTLLWKVIENAREENTLIAAWRDSDEFKKCVEGGKALYKATAFDDEKEQ
ncbi:Glutathione S-transferase S1 [Mortierella alpina]|nr:Glutathione S-transferase S1 [Mortierella alpina]